MEKNMLGETSFSPALAFTEKNTVSSRNLKIHQLSPYYISDTKFVLCEWFQDCFTNKLVHVSMSLSELLYNVASNSIFVINASNKKEEQ